MTYTAKCATFRQNGVPERADPEKQSRCKYLRCVPIVVL